MAITNVYPRSEGMMKFGAIAFRVVETKESRSIGTNYQLVYDVFMDPPYSEELNEELFTHLINAHNLSDEVIIGWNVFDYAGWTFFNRSLVKKWPPACARTGTNSYQVTITYAPLNVINFQIAPTKVKRYFARRTVGWEWRSTGFVKIDILPDGRDNESISFRAINVDENGKVHGVDVLEPSFTWTERWTWGPYKYLSAKGEEENINYFMIMTDITGATNEFKFRGCPPGTVLFCGGQGRQTQPFTWEIDYQFDFKPLRNEQEFAGIEFDMPQELRGGHQFTDGVYPKKGIPVTLHEKNYILQFPDIIKAHEIYPIRSFEPLGLCGEIGLGSGYPFSFLDNVPELEGKIECAVQAEMSNDPCP